ncbi:PSD1 and planctomycete cytochrome C domain-containing protein [Armatimonas rosea]|uniref:DUF1553 domain-containing protein n=1 Tax=Armatimonas rosea TaxID=685828 RepID=A0A7W9W5K7_ARMRO|nr:PSD1 and planctomycete cytochrome C domain-containing protein [Armatimonas rosea]MBB6050569.1 hypothetical protein [Armatimonas rosea]
MKRELAGLLALTGLVTAAALAQSKPKSAAPDFNREVRPILANYCLKCHGPDDKHREAGLRLDQSPGAAKLKEVLARISKPAGDALQMPPSHTNKPLSAAQKSILQRWVASGAKYEKHWAFVSPLTPARRGDTIDSLVSARLKPRGLALQPEADRYTLIRRVSLDLTGLPPTLDETEAFVKDTRPDAYEKLVDRLLASPHYGERWARKWLDLARYADTNGYEKDKPRTIWPWRDWVIKALNNDMPFDQFTIKQLAGDLLPGATLDDKIATGFHRNTMLNEEGGIDPLEFRYYAMVDRMATTGATWLGLTIQCAQCHTHKYDPITHKEYYQLMAFLDNTEEPELDVVTPELAKKRTEVEKTIAEREATLAESWPLALPLRWSTPAVGEVKVASGAKPEVRPDGAVFVSGTNPDKDTYTLTLAGGAEPVSALRLEALTDPALGGMGPGRTAHGNFVLTELEVKADGKPVKLVRGEHDFAQDGFSAQAALDGKPNTGWAIAGTGNWNVNRTATFSLAKPTAAKTWTVTLRQDYGGQHTLGKFRLSLATPQPDSDPRPVETRRKEAFERAFATWKATQQAGAVRWEVVKPVKASSNLPLLTIQPDGIVYVSGDGTKRDVYDIQLASLPKGVTGVRLEALPDDRLPSHGPGRVAYEGPHGDFHLSTLTPSAGKLVKGVSNVGNAQNALDTNPQTGWNINGSQGKPSVAVFSFEKPLETDTLALTMVFEQYYAAGLGKFRLSVTTDSPPAPKNGGGGGFLALLPALEDALARNDDAALRTQFVRVAPELASARTELESLRRSLPQPPTTLVFIERPKENPRATFIHNRGEFLQPTEKVSAAVPALFSPLPLGEGLGRGGRLAFARWLVSPENPLTARVIVNRAWAAFFGKGIVKTTEDFGYQGTPPTHPELLDNLAVEFMRSGWSQKTLHKRIVMSQTYRQSSKVTPQSLAKDPENLWLSRGPRVRLDAELVRDSALTACGLLSPKLGGASVFPPQPPSVTTEGAYGALAWNVSTGEDRYRRGLYTFAKRTAPYAMFQTFDGPSGEACVARRDISNTPLQALTLLNDTVFMEAAQALGKHMASEPGLLETRVARLFRRVVTRPPSWDELTALTAFYEKQERRFASGELSAKALCGTDTATPEQAAWTALARAVLNLDEAIVKR